MRDIFKSIGLALVLAIGLGLSGAQAQVFYPGQGQTHDEVTGLLCVTPACDTVRFDTAEARCICQKRNPTERNLSRLELQCSAHDGRRWVECPVVPSFMRWGSSGG